MHSGDFGHEFTSGKMQVNDGSRSSRLCDVSTGQTGLVVNPSVLFEVDQGAQVTVSSGPPAFNEMANEGTSAREVVRYLLPHVDLPDSLSEEDICQIIRRIWCSERPRRARLPQFSTFDDAVELFKKSTRILVLTGAGVSVSCGIPDFRSKGGVYARLHVEYPDLPDPTAMFDINYFSRNPRPFFEFAKELFPGRYKASICHHFIKALEVNGKLLRNYTQNIDTLEQVAGIKRVVQCHGSFATATCRNCGFRVNSEVIREDIEAGRVAMCRICNHQKGILKPDIVFFGEDLSDEFHERMAEDRNKVDLVVVIGSSLKVQPVALLPYNVKPEVPQILINRESLPHYTTDIELLGNCDDIVIQIALALGPPYTDILSYKELLDVSGAENELACRKPIVRKVMDEAQFKELVNQPTVKRARLKEELPNMWDARYVAVGSKLPHDSYVFLLPNRNIFPGAEMYYDRDENTFHQLSEQYRSSPLSSSSRSDEHGSSYQEETDCRVGLRAMSLDTLFSSSPVSVESNERANSCPPKMDFKTDCYIECSYTRNESNTCLTPCMQAVTDVKEEECRL